MSSVPIGKWVGGYQYQRWETGSNFQGLWKRSHLRIEKESLPGSVVHHSSALHNDRLYFCIRRSAGCQCFHRRKKTHNKHQFDDDYHRFSFVFVKFLLDGCRDTKGEANHQNYCTTIWVKKISKMHVPNMAIGASCLSHSYCRTSQICS